MIRLSTASLAVNVALGGQMYAFWQGVGGSLPQIPLAGVEGTKVSHPGYEE